MAIVQSIGCPECQKNGHDSSGNHLMVFEDGGKYCNRAHYHSSGEPYYEKAGESQPITGMGITGKIKYTPAQFKELEASGKLSNPVIRAIALQGMRGVDRYAVADDSEKAAMELVWVKDKEFFDGLKIKNLIDRHIRGQFAKLYDVRVGHDAEGKVVRHYYPVHSFGEWCGAKCRELPKGFQWGHLGRMWGHVDMFGMHTLKAVLDSGTRKHKLLVVGGECDAMAAQQMLVESQAGTQYASRLYHVWSPTKGENCMEQIIANREHINQFKEIIWGFDADEVGQRMNREAARLFPSKSKVLLYPAGCKDANKCLKAGMHKEFVDSWFNPSEVNAGSKIKSIHQLSDAAKVLPSAGKSWPWSGMNRITIGLRDNMLYLFGAGSGVGKTATTKEIIKHILEVHEEPCGVIYTEEPAKTTVRSFAGKWISKRLELPPTNDPADPDYDVSRDYTQAESDAAIDSLSEKGLFVADLAGDTSIDAVMMACEEMLSMGIKNIVIDNLTGITLPKEMGNKVDAIDEAMKRIGNFKDEKPVRIFLYSHLKKVSMGRVPHEEGGEVILDDFRGSGSIKFWANYAFGIRRNTRGETLEERCTTILECLKDRDQGVMAGEKVIIIGNLAGDLREAGFSPHAAHHKREVSRCETKQTTDSDTETETESEEY